MPKRKRKRKGSTCPACQEDLRWCQGCKENLCTNPDCENIGFYSCSLCGIDLCGDVIPCCSIQYLVTTSYLVLCDFCVPQALEKNILCSCEWAVTECFIENPHQSGPYPKSLCTACAQHACRMCRAVILQPTSHNDYCVSCYIKKFQGLLSKWMTSVISTLVMEYAEVGKEYSDDS